MWVLHERGVHTALHYLDDFLVLGPPGTPVCGEALATTLALCAELGFPVADDKTEGPATVLMFLGIEIDTIQQQVRLPEDKLGRLASTIASWMRQTEPRRSAKKRDLLSLLGLLHHAATVVRPGRAFLRSLIDAAKTVQALEHRVHLNCAARADLAWWHMFLRTWNGTSIMPPRNPWYRMHHRMLCLSHAAFCMKYGVGTPYPLQEDTLCRYVAFLAKEGLKHRSIKSYLSGIRWWQIQLALGNPFVQPMPRLEYVLTGIKRVECRGGNQPRTRLPITMEVLQRLKDVWLAQSWSADGVMLWAAACVGFFGFLRAGEFTVPSSTAYDPETHLNLSDVALDSHTNPSMARLLIKQSKTDPFRQGVEIFLGRSGAEVCPVQALIQYIGVRPPTPGPLFILSTGAPLTRAHLSQISTPAIGTR